MLNMLRSEAGLINAVVLLSWIFIMPIITILVLNVYAIWAIALFALVLIGMLASLLYGRNSEALKGLKADERTEKYTLKAARNGFLMAVGLTAVLIVASVLSGSRDISNSGLTLLFLWIWGWAIGTYQLSNLYYLMRG